MEPAHSQNQKAWDERARTRDRHTRMAGENALREPHRSLDPEGWLQKSIQNQRVLCLGAGGGMQSALCAAAGARVTVVDISAGMLDLDRLMAARYGYKMELIQSSMDDLSPLADASFDLVLQPVSSCYLPDLKPVYSEVARVLVPNGLYISQHKQAANLQSSVLPHPNYHILEPYYRKGPLPPVPVNTLHREAGTLEFIHTWETLLGQLCRSGFVIEDVSEPHHHSFEAEPGTFEHRSCFLPPYIKIKARRNNLNKTERKIWIGRNLEERVGNQ